MGGKAQTAAPDTASAGSVGSQLGNLEELPKVTFPTFPMGEVGGWADLRPKIPRIFGCTPGKRLGALLQQTYDIS